VGNNDNRSVLKKFIQILYDCSLVVCIQRVCSLIEENVFRFFVNCTGDHQSLFLPLTDALSRNTYFCSKSKRLFRNKIIQICNMNRFGNQVTVRKFMINRDVLFNSVSVHVIVLQYASAAISPQAEVNIIQSLSSNQNLAFFTLIEP